MAESSASISASVKVPMTEAEREVHDMVAAHLVVYHDCPNHTITGTMGSLKGIENHHARKHGEEAYD